MVNKSVQNEVLGCNLKNDGMNSVHFQGKPFNITVIQVNAPTSNAEEGEWFYEDLQDVLETFNFSFFSITGSGIYLDYCDIEWFALEMNKDHSVIFEIAPKYCFSESFVDYEGYSFSLKGFLPTVVDIMVI